MADERKRRGWGWTATMWLIIVLLLYPLSFGPVVWLYDHGHIERDTFNQLQKRTIYKPLLWWHDRSETFSDLLEWYVYLL